MFARLSVVTLSFLPLRSDIWQSIKHQLSARSAYSNTAHYNTAIRNQRRSQRAISETEPVYRKRALKMTKTMVLADTANLDHWSWLSSIKLAIDALKNWFNLRVMSTSKQACAIAESPHQWWKALAPMWCEGKRRCVLLDQISLKSFQWKRTHQSYGFE